MKQVEMLSEAIRTLSQLRDHKDPVSSFSVPEDASAIWDSGIHERLEAAADALHSAIRRGGYDAPRPFFLPHKQREELTPTEPWTDLMDMIQSLNQMVDRTQYQTLSIKAVVTWLEKQGLLDPVAGEDSVWCRTPKAVELGVTMRLVDGIPREAWLPSAQQFLLDHLSELAQWNWEHKEEVFLTQDQFHPDEVRSLLRDMEQLAQGVHPDTGEALDRRDILVREEARDGFKQAARVLRCSLAEGYYTAAPTEARPWEGRGPEPFS